MKKLLALIIACFAVVGLSGCHADIVLGKDGQNVSVTYTDKNNKNVTENINPKELDIEQGEGWVKLCADETMMNNLALLNKDVDIDIAFPYAITRTQLLDKAKISGKKITLTSRNVELGSCIVASEENVKPYQGKVEPTTTNTQKDTTDQSFMNKKALGISLPVLLGATLGLVIFTAIGIIVMRRKNKPTTPRASDWK